MSTIKLFYPNGMHDIWHVSADGKNKYRLDGIEKLVRLKSLLEKNNRFEVMEINESSTELFRLAHSLEYLNALKNGHPKELAESSGLLWQPHLPQVFANSAQALILACKEALQGRQTGVISKGGHHATSTRGFGFNPINEIAICVNAVLQNQPSLKICVIDLDIHFGNGLHQLLANKQNVLLLDIWSKTNEKWGHPVLASNLISFQVQNKAEYDEKLDIVVKKALDFKPDLVIYHSGMDIYEKDRLGGIAGFDMQAIRLREEKVIKSFPNGLVLVPGGGYVNYNDPIQKKVGMEELVELYIMSFELLQP